MPRLYEYGPFSKDNKNLPDKVGKIKIRWFDNESRSIPTIPPEFLSIHLTYSTYAEFLPLDDHKCFIYHVPNDDHPYWFCGERNGHAFVIGLTKRTYEAYIEGFVKGFFNSLKPGAIKRAEERYQNESIMYYDLFTIKIPFNSLQEINDMSHLFNRPGMQARVLKNNYFLNRKYHIDNQLLAGLEILGGMDVMLCEGVIKRNIEHCEPLELDGINIVVQMNHLHEIQCAQMFSV